MSQFVATISAESNHPVIGKTARDEGYPFGSFLLPRPLRPHVAAFYRFARQADDIADSPDIGESDKIALLNRLEAVLDGRYDAAPVAQPTMQFRHSLLATGLAPAQAKALLAAFRQDARGWRCETWEDLVAYCRLSAMPVGRYLLALHGESTAAYGPADALCAAVQILNHIQDCRADQQVLGRVYLPAVWLRAEGASTGELTAAGCSPALRRVIDRVLDGTERLLEEAAPLPRHLDNRRLRAEAAVIHALAERLLLLLRSEDPVASRVKLGAVESSLAFCAGLWRAATAW